MDTWSAVAPYAMGGAVGALAFLLLRRRDRRSLSLPPGPPPLPLIGNLLDLPREKEWLTYQKWNNQYGDIVYFEALGLKVVVLGSADAVHDLLETRGNIYSDRPSSTMMNLMEFGWAFVTLSAGERWRSRRKLMFSHMHHGAVSRYHPVQLAGARRFAQTILATERTPEALFRAFRLYSGQTILKEVYGVDVDDEQDDFIKLPAKIVSDFEVVAVPGHFLVDFLPFLKYLPTWFPGASFHRFAQANHATQNKALSKPIEVVQTQMAAGTAPPSMARNMLEEDAERPPGQSRLDAIRDAACMAYVAGGDNTGGAMLSFVLAVLVNPEIQTKAQAQIDRVVGKHRLPECSDAKNLPYVTAIVREILRWLPVGPVGVPHRLTQDDEYKGYHIPKGTTVIGSVWGILQNPVDYPEPERFIPERYLTPEGTLDPNVRDPRTASFGFGRRICPGRIVAESTIFATVATLIATVDIVRAKDAQGVEIVPDVSMMGGLVCCAKPFPWDARPRSEEALALLASAEAESH